MSLNIVSTTDSPKDVKLAMGITEMASEKEGKKSAPESEDSQEQKQASESDTDAKEEAEEEIEESEGESDEESEESNDSEKPKKKGGIKRRIDKLNARVAERDQKLSEREKEIEYWKEQALKQASSPKNDQVEPKVEAQGKPKAEDFESYSDFAEALADWKFDDRESKVKQAAENAKRDAEIQTVIKSHHEREAAFAEKTDDYKETIEELFESKPKVSLSFEQLITTSDNGPEILYALAKDPKEFARINALPPLALAREIGRIESKLAPESSEESKPEIKKITKAPRPLAPVGTNQKGVVPKTPDEMSYQDYKKWREAELKRK